MVSDTPYSPLFVHDGVQTFAVLVSVHAPVCAFAFFDTLAPPCPHSDIYPLIFDSHQPGKHVVFGRVIRGYEDVIPRIVDVPTDEKDRPRAPIVISNCGELELRRKPVAQQPHQRKHHSQNPFLSPFPSVAIRVVMRRCLPISPFPALGALDEPETRSWLRLTTVSFFSFPPFVHT